MIAQRHIYAKGRSELVARIMPVLRAMLSPYVIDPSQRASSRPMTEAEKEAPMSRVVVDQAIALGAWAPRSRAAALAPTPAAPGAAPPQPPLALSQVRLVASYRSRGWPACCPQHCKERFDDSTRVFDSGE